jgi:hypothetical protein
MLYERSTSRKPTLRAAVYELEAELEAGLQAGSQIFTFGC